MSLATILAWWYLVHLGSQMSPSLDYDQRMAAMGMSSSTPWTAADVWFTFAMWAVMMVGMMAPSALPVLLLFAAAYTRSGKRGAAVSALWFGAGYFAVWTGFGALAALAQWGLHQAAMLSPAMKVASPRVGGAALLAAGVYQLSPWKGRCLTHCRSPLGFLLSHWRAGRRGAVRMGADHGAYCLGCCWALMGVLFVVGVMNLVWVAALTVVVLFEKIGPAGAALARATGAGMIVGSLALIALG